MDSLRTTPGSHLRTLSARPGKPVEAPPTRDRFQASAERPQADGGFRWAAASLAVFGTLLAGAGVAHAQLQSPAPALSLVGQQQTETPLVVAHRGDTAHATENTLDAFRAAFAAGADAVELDIHLTQDGNLAVIHDDTLDRTFGRPGVVTEMTADELRAAGVPMLSEVLELPNGKFIIEIKHPKNGRHLGIEQVVIDTLERAHADDRSVVISFDEQSLRTLHQLDPALNTGYLYGGHKTDLQAIRNDLGVTYIGPHFSEVTPAYVQEAHQSGLRVNAWTVDDAKDMQRMIDLDCDAITTDHSGNLVQLLHR